MIIVDDYRHVPLCNSTQNALDVGSEVENGLFPMCCLRESSPGSFTEVPM